MQLLILKLLYVLFTTKGMSEYFYTNDLCVLVDVFVRELADLGDEHESVSYIYPTDVSFSSSNCSCVTHIFGFSTLFSPKPNFATSLTNEGRSWCSLNR
jgi:hypothetical protein